MSEDSASAILEKLTELQAAVSRLEKAREFDASPWCRGNEAAATFAGFKTAKTFQKWAKSKGIKKSKSDGIDFWSKADIRKARENKSIL